MLTSFEVLDLQLELRYRIGDLHGNIYYSQYEEFHASVPVSLNNFPYAYAIGVVLSVLQVSHQ